MATQDIAAAEPNLEDYETIRATFTWDQAAGAGWRGDPTAASTSRTKQSTAMWTMGGAI